MRPRRFRGRLAAVAAVLLVLAAVPEPVPLRVAGPPEGGCGFLTFDTDNIPVPVNCSIEVHPDPLPEDFSVGTPG